MAMSKRKKGLKVWFDAGDVRFLIEAFNLPQDISDRELASVLQSRILSAVKGQPVNQSTVADVIEPSETLPQVEPASEVQRSTVNRIPENLWDSFNEDDED